MVPFLGIPNIRCCVILGVKKGDHNFDNHPFKDNGKENGNYYSILGLYWYN